VAGLDFSMDAAHAAWWRAGVPAVRGELSHAPFAAGSCAAVTMFHVLEHLYDPGEYLRAAHELLAPEGRLIVQVPNAACWQFLLLGERWAGIDVPRHLTDFRAHDLDRLLESCGFEVLRHKHFSLRDNPAGLATSLSPKLDPMARRVRQVVETPRQRLWKDLIYMTLVAAAVPFTLLEAVCRAGSTIMVEARKKS
jgi:SAM-dependent methyltransferase